MERGLLVWQRAAELCQPGERPPGAGRFAACRPGLCAPTPAVREERADPSFPSCPWDFGSCLLGAWRCVRFLFLFPLGLRKFQCYQRGKKKVNRVQPMAQPDPALQTQGRGSDVKEKQSSAES